MISELPPAVRDSGLPIVPLLGRIEEALDAAGALVLQAEPGAGKTTMVPPALLGARFMAGRGMVVLEPRRIAAVAAAARIAYLLGEPLGATAGYSVRLERRVSRSTRIEMVTEGLAVRRIIEDPGLQGVGLMVLDEFHERSAHADLALALLLEARVLRPDLRVLVMSATLDASRLASFIGCPSISAPGRAYPVQTRYARAGGGDFDAGLVAAGALEALRDTGGDVLVFLAGAREMRRVRSVLEGEAPRVPVADLHGTMSLDEQRQVIEPRSAGEPRIVLATNVAETSLTVPGVRAVVDSGFVRVSRFHPRSGMNRLVTERVSAASADQRRGRAARLGPGLCVRCWDEAEPLARSTEPEIRRCELSSLVLSAALWGVREPEGLRFLDPPPPALWRAARELLQSLNAVDGDGAPTARGRALARTGLEPRLGAVVEEGARSGRAALACACAALLATRDDSSLREDADFRLRVAGLRAALVAGAPRSPYSRAVREHRHLFALSARGASAGGAGAAVPATDDCGALLLAAFPDRLARRVERGLFCLASGRVARLRGSLEEEDLVVAVEADAGEATGTIALAAPVTRAEVEGVLAHLVEEEEEIAWQGWTPRARHVSRLGRLVLVERPLARPSRADADAVGRSLAQRVRAAGIGGLPWSQRGLALLERLRAAGACGRVKGLGDFSDAALLDAVEEWLVPFADLGGGPALDSGRLERALGARAGAGAGGAAVAAALEREAPESLRLPSGARRPIVYGQGDPYVAARIQDVFGLRASPVVCGRPLVFRLLSPANRPLQITGDLASFWRTAYPQLRKAMRARYPKHKWPEDPQAPGPSEARPRSPRPRRSGPTSRPVE